MLNLPVWFAIHAIFRGVRPIAAGPVRFDLPVGTSVDPWALALSVAAIIAMFRLRPGIFATLGPRR
ncbi:hypothetical protein BH10PSE15_BH10PSE15_15350 [soil metagenome]